MCPQGQGTKLGLARSVPDEFPGTAAPAAQRTLSPPQDRSWVALCHHSHHRSSSTQPGRRWCKSWPCMRTGSWTAYSCCRPAHSQVSLGPAPMGPGARGTGGRPASRAARARLLTRAPDSRAFVPVGMDAAPAPEGGGGGGGSSEAGHPLRRWLETGLPPTPPSGSCVFGARPRPSSLAFSAEKPRGRDGSTARPSSQAFWRPERLPHLLTALSSFCRLRRGAPKQAGAGRERRISELMCSPGGFPEPGSQSSHSWKFSWLSDPQQPVGGGGWGCPPRRLQARGHRLGSEPAASRRQAGHRKGLPSFRPLGDGRAVLIGGVQGCGRNACLKAAGLAGQGRDVRVAAGWSRELAPLRTGQGGR